MTETMLPRVVSLRDVPDIERLCRGVLLRRQRTGHIAVDVSSADHSHFLAFLIGECFVQSEKYDPRRQLASSPGRLPSFRYWLYGVLLNRLIDEVRTFYGRQGQHRAIADTGTAGAGGLGDALAEGPGDRLDDWAVARGRVADGRDSEAAREARLMGLRSGRTAPSRARGADRRGDLADGPWLDCPACGWRSYPRGPNGHPGWEIPPECTGCGASLPTREARSLAEGPATSRAESEAAA